MMKIIVLILFFANLGYAFSQDSTYYEIDWKLEKGEKIFYSTAFDQLNENSKTDFKSFFDSFSDSSSNQMDELEDILDSLREQFKEFSLISKLSRGEDDVIDIVLIAKPNNPDKKLKGEEAEFINMALSGVQLRGKINLDGGIESFYVKNDQKNLLAILFELPTQKVRVGDKWPIDVNLISMDQNFICNEYQNRNNVVLVDVREIDGSKIAKLKYDIYSFVKGEFKNPFNDKSIPSSMEMIFNGICEFNIDEGKWKDFNGIMSLISTGYLNSNSKQSIKLVEIPNPGDGNKKNK
jgi:hypothetical protein